MKEIIINHLKKTMLCCWHRCTLFVYLNCILTSRFSLHAFNTH